MDCRVLVLRALGLGDLLTGVPALRALGRAMPEAHLALAAPAALAELVELLPEVDELLPTAGLDDVVAPWEPDVAVNLHGRGPESHRALLGTRPRRLVAFGNAAAGVDGPVWRADEHEARRWCRLLADGLGVEADPGDGLLGPPPRTDRPGALVVHPGAASPARRWPAERYAEVARRLTSCGDVVVTGGPGEEELAGRVAEAAGLAPDRVVVGLGLAALAGLVGKARLVLSGDTGVAHLAAAYDRPAVALFGPTPPGLWAPAWGRTIVLWRGEAPGDPHAASPDPALLALSTEEVLATALGADTTRSDYCVQERSPTCATS
jgi:ADP-heptose:LPS heptosyltransferase